MLLNDESWRQCDETGGRNESDDTRKRKIKDGNNTHWPESAGFSQSSFFLLGKEKKKLKKMLQNFPNEHKKMIIAAQFKNTPLEFLNHQSICAGE